MLYHTEPGEDVSFISTHLTGQCLPKLMKKLEMAQWLGALTTLAKTPAPTSGPFQSQEQLFFSCFPGDSLFQVGE